MEGKVTESKVGSQSGTLRWSTTTAGIVKESGGFGCGGQSGKTLIKGLEDAEPAARFPDSPRGVSTAVLLCTGRQVSRSYMVFSDFQKEFNSLPCQLAPVRLNKGKTQMQFVFFASDRTDLIVFL